MSDDFDHISEEERRLAAEFARHLEGGDRSEGAVTPTGSLDDLTSPIALLKNVDRFELRTDALRRGRAELEEWAKEGNRAESPKARVLRRWFYWLPVTAIAVAAMALGLRREGTESANHTTTATNLTLERAARHEGESEPGFEKLSPRFHAGQTPQALLRAQAAVLTEREPGRAQEEARDEFDRQMRAYRGQLIASLEVKGR